MPDIWQAVRSGSVRNVERLVGRHPGLLHARDAGGVTPLMCASEEGRLRMVRWLLDKGAVMDERDFQGRTPLYKACSAGCTAVAKLLLRRGADPTIADHNRMTPMMLASCQGSVSVLRRLLRHPCARATLNDRSRLGETALWWASRKSRGACVRALLRAGADDTIANIMGITPMAIVQWERQVWWWVRVSPGISATIAALEVSLPPSSPLHLCCWNPWLRPGVSSGA
jgi:ankyrin repeat protein